VPTATRWDNDPQTSLLSAVRESQTAVLDVVRAWTDMSQRLTRSFGLPVAAGDVAGAVDRAFDVAEQALAAQRQLALTLAGVATRRAATAVEVIATAAEAVDDTVETAEATVIERAHQVENELERDRQRAAQAQTGTSAAPKAEPPKQDDKPDRRTYEERSIEELRARAGELEIEGRSTMGKDELVAALRNHRQPRPAKNDTAKRQPAKQERRPDRRTYEERSVEELRARAGELDIEGRSAMSKDELVAALRKQTKS
jgi:type IV secretory pathway VirB10-like protein